MERVTGIGGIFFKSRDPEALADWYAAHLGVPVQDGGGATFAFADMDDPGRESFLTWAPLAHLGASGTSSMVNFRVDDLDAMLAQLRDGGVEVEPNVDDSEYGRFGWFLDPEGNRVELWEPPARS